MTEQTQPTDAELEACPFCGNANAIVYDDLLTFHAGCLSCGSTGSVSSYRNGAIAAWNRRAVLAKWGTPAGAGEQTMADVIAACNGTEAYGLIIGLRTQVALLEAMMDAQKCDGAGQQSIQTQPTLGEPVGEVQHLHEWNDEWLSKLPIGTKLYTTPQPTQAQAGAVPLTVQYPEGYGNPFAKIAYDAGWRAAEHAHGIKGAAHG